MPERFKVTVVVRGALWPMSMWKKAISVGIKDGVLIVGIDEQTTRVYPLENVEYYEFSKVGK